MTVSVVKPVKTAVVAAVAQKQMGSKLAASSICMVQGVNRDTGALFQKSFANADVMNSWLISEAAAAIDVEYVRSAGSY